jgi:hypothetical protein
MAVLLEFVTEKHYLTTLFSSNYIYFVRLPASAAMQI